jgi:hypothetical protein
VCTWKCGWTWWGHGRKYMGRNNLRLEGGNKELARADGVLKSTVWPSGQVGTGRAATYASYILWDSGWGTSMTGWGKGHPPCSCSGVALQHCQSWPGH